MREAAEDESGCAAAADGTSCDDENPCTSDDACHSGRCVGVVPEECPTPGQCQVGVCAPTTGACDVTFEPFGTACDDGNGCTDNDFCGVSVCLPGPPHSCDDFDPCTTDACVAGACVHGAVQCPPPSDVCVAPVCRSDFSSGLRGCGFEPITDCCHDDAECDNGNVCTHDACDPGSHRARRRRGATLSVARIRRLYHRHGGRRDRTLLPPGGTACGSCRTTWPRSVRRSGSDRPPFDSGTARVGYGLPRMRRASGARSYFRAPGGSVESGSRSS